MSADARWHATGLLVSATRERVYGRLVLRVAGGQAPLAVECAPQLLKTAEPLLTRQVRVAGQIVPWAKGAKSGATIMAMHCELSEPYASAVLTAPTPDTEDFPGF